VGAEAGPRILRAAGSSPVFVIGDREPSVGADTSRERARVSSGAERGVRGAM